MGLAYTEIKQYDEAVQSYTKALEFDPSNESYKNNLRIAQDLANKASAPPPPTGVYEIFSLSYTVFMAVTKRATK